MYPFTPLVDKQFMVTLMKTSQSTFHDESKALLCKPEAEVPTTNEPKTQKCSMYSLPGMSVETTTKPSRSSRKHTQDMGRNWVIRLADRLKIQQFLLRCHVHFEFVMSNLNNDCCSGCTMQLEVAYGLQLVHR